MTMTGKEGDKPHRGKIPSLSDEERHEGRGKYPVKIGGRADRIRAGRRDPR